MYSLPATSTERVRQYCVLFRPWKQGRTERKAVNGLTAGVHTPNPFRHKGTRPKALEVTVLGQICDACLSFWGNHPNRVVPPTILIRLSSVGRAGGC